METPPEGPFSRWARDLGFLPHLLPIMPTGARLTPHSGVKRDQIGKIPGEYVATKCAWRGMHWRGKEGPHVATEGEIAIWNSWPGVRVGLGGTDFKAADNDVIDPVLHAVIRDLQSAMLPLVPRRIGSAPKCLSMWRCAEPFDKVQIAFYSQKDRFGNLGALELLGHKQQWLVDGLHPSGSPYTYEGPHPTEIGAYPTITADDLRNFGKAAIETATALGYYPVVTQGKASLYGRTYDRRTGTAPENLDRAVEYARWEIENDWLPNGRAPVNGNRNHTAHHRAVRLHRLGVPEPDAVELLLWFLSHGHMPDEDVSGIVHRAYGASGLELFGSELPEGHRASFSKYVAGLVTLEAPPTAVVEQISFSREWQRRRRRELWEMR